MALTIVADRNVSEGIEFYEASVRHRAFSIHFGYVDAFPYVEPDYD